MLGGMGKRRRGAKQPGLCDYVVTSCSICGLTGPRQPIELAMAWLENHDFPPHSHPKRGPRPRRVRLTLEHVPLRVPSDPPKS